MTRIEKGWDITMNKQNILVIFGGQSSEHEVSCMSVQTIIKNINEEHYEIHLVGITKEGEWLLVDSMDEIVNDTWRASKKHAVLSPDATKKELIIEENGAYQTMKIDVAFPVLHGLHGEDGTIQGLFELAKIPYVGCGVLASAVSMDKFHTKVIVDTLDIRQAKWIPVRKNEMKHVDKVIERIENGIAYPVFVKPANAGSSQGVSKANDREELIKSIETALQHDTKVLVEETIIGREIECAVLGGEELKASGVGEVLAAAEFYDYEAKYFNAESKTNTHPEFPEGKEEEVREKALKIFEAVDGYGLARVDFFLEKDTNEVVFNELNTLPGFTSISMYPMLWAEKGMETTQLVEKLIQLAYKRYDR